MKTVATKTVATKTEAVKTASRFPRICSAR